jgi:hypothetical protein
MPEFQVKPNDIPMMFLCLEELFLEFGNKVTPTNLAERMSKKLNKPIDFRYASYLSRQFGFITMQSTTYKDKLQRYIIPDYELLKKVKGDNKCQV